METVEEKVKAILIEVEDIIDQSDRKNKNKIKEDLYYIDDVFNKMLDYIYAESDNLRDLEESIK